MQWQTFVKRNNWILNRNIFNLKFSMKFIEKIKKKFLKKLKCNCLDFNIFK